MTPEQVVEVVGILAVSFAREATAELFEVYEEALGDLEVEEPRRIVKRLIRTLDYWPSPGKLRRLILADHGLLAPDEDEAWRAVVAASVHGGTSGLHPAAREALDAVGGPWGVRTGQETTIRAQWRDAYRLTKARHDKEALERTWTDRALTRGRDDRALGN